MKTLNVDRDVARKCCELLQRNHLSFRDKRFLCEQGIPIIDASNKTILKRFDKMYDNIINNRNFRELTYQILQLYKNLTICTQNIYTH